MLDILHLDWEQEVNVAHIWERHRLTAEEVEAVCHGEHFFTETYGGRLRLIGPSPYGRMLTIILAPKGNGVFYPVTARPASRKERGIYRKGREEEQQ